MHSVRNSFDWFGCIGRNQVTEQLLNHFIRQSFTIFTNKSEVTQLRQHTFLTFDHHQVTFHVRNLEYNFSTFTGWDDESQQSFVWNVHIDVLTLTTATVSETVIVILKTTNSFCTNGETNLIQAIHIVYKFLGVEKGAVHDNVDTADVICREPTEESVHHSAGHVGIALFDLHLKPLMVL
ncbi:hypothetical protein D9M71_624240 [compost metagenome]